MKKQKIVILTGAGISAESGIQTFRDADGLWEGHDVMAVASPAGWAKNQKLVLNFYNQRRALLHTVEPNEGHKALVKLEQKYNVCIITQNVDDLHERAGSTNVLHLHGELKKMRSVLDSSMIYDCEGDINEGDRCDKGGQLRPHIVWFGEAVPMIEKAVALSQSADIFIIIGTSMNVYPAAGLVEMVADAVPKYFVDPKPTITAAISNLKIIAEKGTIGIPQLVKELMQ